MEDFLLYFDQDTQWSVENSYNSSSSPAICDEDVISSTPKSVAVGSEPDNDISYSELYGNGLNESTLRNEYEDLYEDLQLIEEEKRKTELNRDAEYERMKKEYGELKSKNEENNKKIKDLEAAVEKFKMGMCSLFKTCQAEVKRKESFLEAAQKQINFSQFSAKKCYTCKQKCPYCNIEDELCKRRRSESPESKGTKSETGTTSSQSDLLSAKNVNTNILSIFKDKHEKVSQKADERKVQKSNIHEIRDSDTCDIKKSDSDKLEKSEPHNSQLHNSELDNNVSNENKSQKSGGNRPLEHNAKLQSYDKSVVKETLDIDDQFNKVVPTSVKMSFTDYEQNQMQLITAFKKSLIKAYDNSDVDVQSPTLDSTSKEQSTSKKFHHDNRSESSSVSSRSTHASSSYRKHKTESSEHFEDYDNAHHSRSYRIRKPLRKDYRAMSRKPYRRPYEQGFKRR